MSGRTKKEFIMSLQPSSTSSIRTKLCCSSKYSPEQGFTDLSISLLGIALVIKQYEKEQVSTNFVASSIIESLFKRDFTPGRHWEEEPAFVRATNGKDLVFEVEKSATWDWKDIYSVASAKACIRFLPDQHEIQVENYSYYVAGWTHVSRQEITAFMHMLHCLWHIFVGRYIASERYLAILRNDSSNESW